jgi:hypothetical protein
MIDIVVANPLAPTNQLAFSPTPASSWGPAVVRARRLQVRSRVEAVLLATRKVGMVPDPEC